MDKVTPAEFARQVRQETAKVTWPTRKETITTTIMVFVMAIILAIVFFGIDKILAWGVKALLGFGG
jgi:preprotein translocase subunit SecE